MIKQIAVGNYHTVALKSDGTVWAWGYNDCGQLGDGTTTQRPTPVKVNGLTGVTAIAAGDSHTVALKSDGTVWAWGLNNYGQLGDGTTTDRAEPVHVNNMNEVAAIVAGKSNTVILKSDGTVYRCGYGLDQDALIPNWREPHPLSITGVVDISTSYNYTVFLKSDGTVWAQGLNNYGQLGNGTNTNALYTSVQATGLNGVVAIASGESYTEALKSDGTVWGWGLNAHGELGNGTNTNSNIPEQIKLNSTTYLTEVVAISGGPNHTVAVKSNGTVWTWGGYPYRDLLGNWALSNNPTPVQVDGLTGVVTIASGNDHTVALKSDGTVWAWGNNTYCQLGDGTETNRAQPVQVSGVDNTGYFNILDVTDPTVSSTLPANGANDVSLISPITVTFSENVSAGTAYGNITLKDGAGVAISTTNSISGAVLTINPLASLGGGTTYTVTIPASAIKDALCNNLASQYTFSFTTAATQTMVTGLGIGEILTFGKYNNVDLKWYYMGNGYFILANETCANINIQRVFDNSSNDWASSELNLWLNNKTNGFIKEALNNDPRIAYVTIPTLEDYKELGNVCGGGGVPNGYIWWLRSFIGIENGSGTLNGYVMQDTNVSSSLYANADVSTYKAVRPAFRIKAETGGATGTTNNSVDGGVSSTYLVTANKDYKLFITDGEYGTVAGTVCDATDVESGGVGTDAVLAISPAGSGVTIIKANPTYNNGEGFASEGMKKVTIGTKTIYIKVVAPLAAGTVTVTF